MAHSRRETQGSVVAHIAIAERETFMLHLGLSLDQGCLGAVELLLVPRLHVLHLITKCLGGMGKSAYQTQGFTMLRTGCSSRPGGTLWGHAGGAHPSHFLLRAQLALEGLHFPLEGLEGGDLVLQGGDILGQRGLLTSKQDNSSQDLRTEVVESEQVCRQGGRGLRGGSPTCSNSLAAH